MRLGVGGAVVEGSLVPGDVEVREGSVGAVGLSPPGRSGTAVPGYVDLQVNGFAGVDFLFTDAAGYERAGRALATTGVTAYQATFISSPPEAYEQALDLVDGLPERPGGVRLLGVHLEGPFISRRWAGAHNPDNTRDPDPEFAARLLDRARVTYMTLAPELPGGLDLISNCLARQIIVACGHSDADAACAHAAFDAGARAVTHIYNAQRRWESRDPGLAGVALVRPDVTVTAIVDHKHLAPETEFAVFLATRERFALITDAIMAAGLPDGSYTLGDRSVAVKDGTARVDDGKLAGSVATMDGMVRNLVAMGASLPDAVRAASTTPAEVVGRPEIGTLAPGTPADIAILDDELFVTATLVGGQEVFAR